MAGMRMLECIFDFDPEIEDEVRSHFATDLMSVPSSTFFFFFFPPFLKLIFIPSASVTKTRTLKSMPSQAHHISAYRSTSEVGGAHCTQPHSLYFSIV